ncbi:hypothetical protein OG884_08150 [Streptosporangium sp. NBC_01755]|uniref:hypothetical protein n=1 Tax=Streptosporangium sp. NBC_01755 TaxID=2975949 RepID=UPI002DD90C2F|nr:hypothetical protein [Streptosporangium sp. NBC_01755]WSD01881.1 hypothetical protein OG884_08150 [Streptosporangium sp. NBC_01755]
MASGAGAGLGGVGVRKVETGTVKAGTGGETYAYFATDPVTGWEHYTQGAGPQSSSGTLGNLSGGQVKVEVWSAIGNGTTSLGVGNQSLVRLPFS